jgi:hypothetical protein
MMLRYFSISFVLLSFTAGGTLRVATKPHAETVPETNRTWTNEDLDRLGKVPALISVVGQPAPEESETAVALPSPYVETHDPERYAEQAAKLRDELQRRQGQLHEYWQALDDERSLREITGGINLDEGDLGITPEASIEILQQRVNETQSELNALEDLARRNDIPPGTLRGQ